MPTLLRCGKAQRQYKGRRGFARREAGRKLTWRALDLNGPAAGLLAERPALLDALRPGVADSLLDRLDDRPRGVDDPDRVVILERHAEELGGDLRAGKGSRPSEDSVSSWTLCSQCQARARTVVGGRSIRFK